MEGDQKSNYSGKCLTSIYTLRDKPHGVPTIGNKVSLCISSLYFMLNVPLQLNCLHINVVTKNKIYMKNLQAAKRRQLSAIEASRLQDITHTGSVLLTVVTVTRLRHPCLACLPTPATMHCTLPLQHVFLYVHFIVICFCIYTFFLFTRTCLHFSLVKHDNKDLRQFQFSY